MRLCLACRRLSSDTPLCTHCGRSFGGRMCSQRRCRHLNPTASNSCGQCGSATLADPATCIPITGAARLLACGALLGGIILVAPAAAYWIGDATGYSHYRDGRVWLIETTGRLLMPFLTIFFILYMGSHMVPGEGGRLIRTALVGTTMWIVRGLLNTVASIGKGMGKLISSRASRTRTRQ